MRQNLRYIIPILIPLLILLLPASAFPLEGLTVIQQRVIAIFLLAALCWVMEPIPIYATSVVIIVLELLLLSNKSLYLFRLDQFYYIVKYSRYNLHQNRISMQSNITR